MYICNLQIVDIYQNIRPPPKTPSQSSSIAIARRQDTSSFFWRGPYNTIYVDDDTDVDDNVEVAAEVTLAEVTVDVGVRAAAC